MRIAVISDIHGNVPALEAVLADSGRQAVDAMVCLGDLAFKGPMPGEAVARIRNLGIPCVHGNTDLMLLTQTNLTPTRHLPAGTEIPAAQVPYLRWHVERMGSDDLQYLASLPFDHTLKADGVQIQFVHATPQDCVAAIRPLDPPEAVSARVKHLEADWLVMGHVHLPFVFRCSGKTLINPGAVGFSLDRDWRASYAILDTARGAVTLQRVEYDQAAVLETARERAFPFGTEWYREALELGFWDPIPWAERHKVDQN